MWIKAGDVAIWVGIDDRVAVFPVHDGAEVWISRGVQRLHTWRWEVDDTQTEAECWGRAESMLEQIWGGLVAGDTHMEIDVEGLG